MKNIYLFLRILLFISISFFSCRPQTTDITDNQIRFDSVRITRNYHINNDSTQPSCNLKLAFIYPSDYNDKVALDSLQRIFISSFFDESYAHLSPQDAAKGYEENYIESYKEDARIYAIDRVNEHDAHEVYTSYYEIDYNKIIFNKGGILSYQIDQTNYKGGASSYDFLKNRVIDLDALKILTEEDLFNEGYAKVLGVSFRNSILKSKNVKNLADLESLGYFGLEEMVPNGNFLLDNKGITYIFNKGEYSGYKTDAIKIFIPYEEIKPLIKENAIISKFVSM
jgi:hypothetical protein